MVEETSLFTWMKVVKVFLFESLKLWIEILTDKILEKKKLICLLVYEVS